MPAHIGIAEKLRITARMVIYNLSQSETAKIMRHKRVGKGRVVRDEEGLGRVNNRVAYVPRKLIEIVFEKDRESRERTFIDYDRFRSALNKYDPAENRNGYNADPNEWEMYLKPGTVFDQTCEEAFATHYGTGFKMVLIVHKSDRGKLKRIEAVLASGKVVIMWTDAS